MPSRNWNVTTPARAGLLNAWGRLVMACCALTPASALADVRFEGLEERQETNARAFVDLAAAPCDTPEWQRERLLAKAPQQIAAALEALGHYRSTVRSETSEDEDCWRVVFEVTPGPPVRLAEVSLSVTGAAGDDPAFARLLADSPLREGAVLDHGVYERAKRDLTSTAAARGYFDAALTRSEVLVDVEEGEASAAVQLASGPRYRFGPVSYSADFLDSELIDTYVDVESGEFYDSSSITSTHKALLDTGYFQFVDIDADPLRATDLAVPVNIELAPVKRRIYSGGLGFATDSGPRFRLNYRNRRVNRRGHKLTGDLLLSSVQSLLGTEYRIPLGRDQREALLVRGDIEREDTDTSETDAVELSVRRARARGDDWLETVSVDAQFEDFVVGAQDSSSSLIVPGISWWHLKATTSPRQLGRNWFLELRGTTEAIGSDTSFLQVYAHAKHVIPLGERSRLLARVDAGATAKERFTELPPSARYFAGGDKSVRGYGFESLGPTNADGDVIGGSYLLTASVEVDWAIGERWGVALFADTGSAFSDTSPDFSTGIGFGIRRDSPIGPIRVDFAHPLDADRTVRLHVSFGPDL